MSPHQHPQSSPTAGTAFSTPRLKSEAESGDTPLVVIREDPFNAETRVEDHRGIVTPADAFYVRNHFAMPQLDHAQWQLVLEGSVEETRIWRFEELLALPSRTLLVTLECAGNGRAG